MELINLFEKSVKTQDWESICDYRIIRIYDFIMNYKSSFVKCNFYLIQSFFHSFERTPFVFFGFFKPRNLLKLLELL